MESLTFEILCNKFKLLKQIGSKFLLSSQTTDNCSHALNTNDNLQTSSNYRLRKVNLVLFVQKKSVHKQIVWSNKGYRVSCYIISLLCMYLGILYLSTTNGTYPIGFVSTNINYLFKPSHSRYEASQILDFYQLQPCFHLVKSFFTRGYDSLKSLGLIEFKGRMDQYSFSVHVLCLYPGCNCLQCTTHG